MRVRAKQKTPQFPSYNWLGGLVVIIAEHPPSVPLTSAQSKQRSRCLKPPSQRTAPSTSPSQLSTYVDRPYRPRSIQSTSSILILRPSRPPSPPASPQSATPSSPQKKPRGSPSPNSPKPSVVRKSQLQPFSTAKPKLPRLMQTSLPSCSVWTRNS